MTGEKELSILLIEATTLTRFSCKRILERKGYRVEEAAGGEEGLLKAAQKKEPFDLIILDVYLPDLDGLSVLERLKANPAYRYIPVMILTADTKFTTVKQAIELGAVDYLSKPFTEEELTRRVEKIIGPAPGVPLSPMAQLEKVLALELNRAKRGNHNLALVVCRREQPGPVTISELEKRIRRRLRDIDTVLALSNNSLVLVLPLTGLEGAGVVISKVKTWLPGNWSFGAAVYPDNGKDGEELFNYAQARLDAGIEGDKAGANEPGT